MSKVFKFNIIALLFCVVGLSQAKTHYFIYGEAYITNVVDGDTFYLHPVREADMQAARAIIPKKNIKGNKFKMRLANTNTEESVHPDKSKNTPFGEMTSRFVKAELTGQKVTYQCNDIGKKYGRPICSISLGADDYGVRLVKLGLSSYITKYGNHPTLHAKYQLAEQHARQKGHGIWNPQYKLALTPPQALVKYINGQCVVTGNPAANHFTPGEIFFWSVDDCLQAN